MSSCEQVTILATLRYQLRLPRVRSQEVVPIRRVQTTNADPPFVLISLISRLPCEREIFKTAYADATRTHLLAGEANARATAGYRVSVRLLPGRNRSTSRYRSLPRKMDSLEPDLMSYINNSSAPKAARLPKSESAASATRSRGAFYQYSFMSGVSPRHSRLDF
jgi:hypothetical protein